MASVGDSVLGVEWFKNFVLCRKNLKAFVDIHKLSRDAFCLDILKDLYSDCVDNQCKFHLLLILQEHSSYLIQDEDLLEQMVGSLQNLHHTLVKCEEKKLFKSQILITITAILLTWKNMDENIFRLILHVKTLLLETILCQKKDHVLRSTACRCLEEIEVFFPGILKSNIDAVVLACQNQLSPPFQSYIVLLSMCLKHATDPQMKKGTFLFFREALSFAHGIEPSSPMDNEMQILPIVSYMLDQLSFMNQTSVFLVLENLIHVVKNSPELFPSTFKPFSPRLIVTSDVLYFHLALDLLKTFGLELFSAQEEQMLLRQLLSSATHPSLTTSHRLLYLDWLETCITEKNIFSCIIPNSSLDTFIPGPFDGPYTQEKKIRLLSHYVYENAKTTVPSELLMSSLGGLKRRALLSTGVKASASFFRAVFMIFSLHKTNEIHLDIYKLILDVVTTSPHLSPYVIDFLNCLKTQCNERSFCDGILTKLVDHVLNLPIKQFAKDAQNYLLILEAAAIETSDICKPQVTLRHLQKLLMETNTIKTDVWILGNSILSVCRAILKFHDVEILYHDLGELLHLVMKNVDDVDVKIRAKQYYAAVTSLSKTRLQALFETQSYEKNGNSTLSTFVTGRLSAQNIIHTLSKPVLQLCRVEKKYMPFVPDMTCVENAGYQEDLLDLYKVYLKSKSFQPSVKIPFVLELLEDVEEKFSTLFGVAISIQSSPTCKTISSIEVPVLTKNKKDSGTLVNVEFIPFAPHPLVLHFRAEFTCSNGYSYSCNLPSVTIEFKDLFSLIPVPQPIHVTESLWKNELFDVLWEHFQNEANLNIEHESSCCKSSCRLDSLSQDISTLVKEKWEPFVVSRPPESPTFRIAIYLPPSSHFLMKLSVLNDATFVNLLTDNWTILPWISNYLNRLF